jgi:hypothetical protein
LALEGVVSFTFIDGAGETDLLTSSISLKEVGWWPNLWELLPVEPPSRLSLKLSYDAFEIKLYMFFVLMLALERPPRPVTYFLLLKISGESSLFKGNFTSYFVGVGFNYDGWLMIGDLIDSLIWVFGRF